ncbi:MAG: hypothetical protein O7G88_15475 [bacterium]|nr:hypothetical protein [bacterium]
MATIRTRTNADDSTVYHVQVRMKGHRTQSETFQRLTDAKRWAQRTASDIREGRHFPGTAAKRHTLGETIERYRETVLSHKTKNTINAQTPQLSWWTEQIGHLRLCDVTPPIVADQRDLLGKPFKAATVKQYLLALSHVFTTAIREWQWTDTNPVLLVNKPRVRFLSDDERRRLLKACKVSANPHLYTLAVLALSTGARRVELRTRLFF